MGRPSSHRIVTILLHVSLTGCLTPSDAISDEGEASTGGTTADATAGPSGGTDPTTAADTSTSMSTSPSTTSDDNTGDEASTDTGVEPTCEGAGFRCVDDAPKGWDGPVARLPDDGEPDRASCGGEFPLSQAAGFAGVIDPGLTCDCDCADPSGGSCDPTISVSVYDAVCNATSGGACVSLGENWNACTSVDDTLDAGPDTYTDSDRWGVRLIAQPPAIESPPTCAANPTVEIPEAGTSDHHELCAQNQAIDETCAGARTCVPDPQNPFSAALCIWAEGEQECPADLEYTERTVLYRSVDDSRSCSACTCGSAQGVECEGEITVVASYSDGGLTFDPAETFPANGSCTTRITPNGTPLAGVNFSVDYDPNPPTAGDCPPTGGDPSGSVAGSDPLTLCCTAERR